MPWRPTARSRTPVTLGGGRLASLVHLGRTALAWWLHELASLVPPRFRERRRNRFDAEIRLERDQWIVRDRAGALTPVMSTDGPALTQAFAAVRGRRRQGRVLVVIPLSRCFVRRSELPRALLGQADTILASELETTTPFHPGTAHWDWFVDRSGPQRDSVILTQVVLKRRDSELLMQRLAEHGLTPLAMTVEDDGSPFRRRLPVDLFRHDLHQADAPFNLRQARRVLVAASVLASLAVVPAAFSRQSAILSDLDSAIADATDAVSLSPGLARAPLEALGGALQAKRNWPVTAVLNGLAATLPNDSHVEHLFLERDVATVQGRTASIHNLERVLGASRLFTAGHNTAAPDSGEGVPFTLRLKIKPAAIATDG